MDEFDNEQPDFNHMTFYVASALMVGALLIIAVKVLSLL